MSKYKRFLEFDKHASLSGLMIKMLVRITFSD